MPARDVAYARPGSALAIAGGGFVVTALIASGYPGVRSGWTAVPNWMLGLVDLIVISLPLAAAVVIAVVVASNGGFARAVGLDRWRWTDLVLGLGVGLLARSLVELAAPTTGSLLGPLETSAAAVVVAAIGAVIVSPLIEELFFRGLTQRALADALPRAPRPWAAVIAVLASTALFVGLHLIASGGGSSPALLIGTVSVGLGCGILTAATGRLGGALVAHAVFNLIGVVLLVA